MPQSLKISSFKSGWCPSDDSKNGRQDGLLKMDNVELDQNGALAMIGGKVQKASIGHAAYDIFSNIIGNNRYDFVARTDGEVDYANGSSVTSLFTGGDTTNTAFGTAYDYTLICSGTKKKKTNISNTYNLGVYTPASKPTLSVGNADYTGQFYQNVFNVQDWSNATPGSSQNVTTNVSNMVSAEGWTNAGSGTLSYDTGGTPVSPTDLKFICPAGAHQIDVSATFSTPLNLVTGSDDPNGDVFSFYIKQSQNDVEGVIFYFTDSGGNVATGGVATGSWPSINLLNQWNLFYIQIRWGASGATGSNGLSFIQYSGASFDWTQISKIEIVVPYNSPSGVDVYIGGLQFTGLRNTPAIPPVTSSGTGFPQATIAKNLAVIETAIVGPIDFATFGSGAVQQDSDLFTFAFRAGVTGSTNYGDASNIKSIQVDILLTNPGSNFNAGSDYYTYTWNNTNTVGTSTNTVSIARSDFTRVGTGSQQWNSVYAIMFTVVVTDKVYIAFGGSSVPGATFANNPTFTFFGGSNALNGTYQYLQVNVNNTGAYVAKSGSGPQSIPINIVNGKTNVTFENPSTHDTQINEVWIYRYGGTLDTFYRVGVIQPANFGAAFVDSVSDVTALETDIAINFNLQSIQSLGKIFDIVGPIEGRWFYFTANTMWPSDINDPDVYDASLGVTTTGSNSEVFLWARKVAEAVVLVGTSRDIHILTGTFVTLPDGTVDIYYRPLVVAFPPITYNAVYFNNAVYYLAKDGWRSVNPGGNCDSLVVPNTDLLYRGDNRYNYTAPTLPSIPGSIRFPVIVARNKLWCSITGQSRIEVYDLARQNWRVINYGSDVTAMFSAQDGTILGMIGTALNSLDDRTSLVASGINILTPVFDNNQPRNRKDSYTLRIRFGGGTSGTITWSVITDSTTVTSTATASSSSPIDTLVDISSTVGIARTYQIAITGSPSNLIIEEFEIYYDARPTELTFVRGYNDNFGTGGKKRVRTWPFVIDTQGNNVSLIPTVDGTAQPTLTVNTNNKTTVLYFFKTDVFGVDYGYTIGGNIFELWGTLQPDVVQVLPVAKQFDQIGPIDFQRYGRVSKIEFRMIAYGTSVPYTIFMDDIAILTGTLPVVNGVDNAYYIGVPKGVSGYVMRIELGPTSFNFHRLSTRILASISGSDTDNQWLQV